MMTENGSALAIAMACNALSPSAMSGVAATMPVIATQNALCQASASVLPRLIRAMNKPTKGAQEIVQPKMNSVQLPIQSLRE